MIFACEVLEIIEGVDLTRAFGVTLVDYTTHNVWGVVTTYNTT